MVEKQPDPATNVTKTSYNLLIPGDAEMVQQIRTLNKSRPQEIVPIWIK